MTITLGLLCFVGGLIVGSLLERRAASTKNQTDDKALKGLRLIANAVEAGTVKVAQKLKEFKSDG